MKSKSQEAAVEPLISFYNETTQWPSGTTTSDGSIVQGYFLPRDAQSLSFSRQWDNTPPNLFQDYRTRSGFYRWIQIKVPVYNGPRLPYKRWSAKKQRWVWAREPIYIWKYKREPIDKRKFGKMAKWFKRPNFLSYLETSVTWGPQDASYSYYADLNLGSGQSARTDVVYSGAPWIAANLQPVSSNNLPIVPNLLVWNGQDLLYSTVGSLYQSYIDEMVTKALAKFFSKAKDQKVNLAQMLGERQQTVGLFTDLATRLAKAALLLKKGKLTSAVTSVFPATRKELANDWLLLQYGLIPLISDLKGIAEELTNDTPISVDLISPARRDVTIEDSRTYFSGFITDKRVTTLQVSAKYKGTLTARPEPWGIAQQFLDRLGFSNWAGLAWELTPWSHVADWIYPLGQYMNTHDALLNQWDQSDAHGTVFLREKTVITRTFDTSRYTEAVEGLWPTVDGNVYCSNATDVTVVIDRVYCHRDPLGVLPQLPLPMIKSPFTRGHALNFAAHIIQLRK